MASEKLAAIKARVAAATPAPWGIYHSLNGWHYTKPGPEPVLTSYDQTKADVEFIAAAREDVPMLVAEVERLTAGIQKAIAACETCGGQGIVTLDYGGEPDEDNCPDCAPLRRLVH